jgi:hypothetical protein
MDAEKLGPQLARRRCRRFSYAPLLGMDVFLILLLTYSHLISKMALLDLK